MGKTRELGGEDREEGVLQNWEKLAVRREVKC